MNKQRNISSAPERQGNGEKGFTLLEILIAIVILSIGILALTRMQVTSIGTNDIAGQITEGTAHTGSEIETVINRAYNDATLDDGNVSTTVYGQYSVTMTVTDSVPIPLVKRINMVVSWNDRGTVRTFTTNYFKAVSY